MKEHLNLNTVSVPSGWVDTPQNQERLNARLASPQAREELLPVPSRGETVALGLEDRFESSIRGNNTFNEAAMDEMDFAAAMEHVNFILEQAHVPEGRMMMSQAHHNITPQRVMQMFGAM